MRPTSSSTLIDKNVQRAIIAVIVAFVAILIRCIYRIAEMAGGWRNPIMQDQILFVVLDGIMCVVASVALNIFHPGAIFQESKRVISAQKSGVMMENGSGSTSAGETSIRLEKRVVTGEGMQA
jgi:hypothetical protein